MFQKLNSLRTDKAQDNVSPRQLARIAQQIAKPVHQIFQKKSLEEGILPLEWKSATVSPIYKSGSKNDPANYRPISLTSQLMQGPRIFNERSNCPSPRNNQLIGETQHGFRKGRSCLTNKLSFYRARLCISAVYARKRCLSVCLSVTFVDHVRTNKPIFEIFSPPGSHTILDFPH